MLSELESEKAKWPQELSYGANRVGNLEAAPPSFCCSSAPPYRILERLPGDPASAWGRRKSSGKSEVSAGTGLLGKVEKMCIIDATLRKGLHPDDNVVDVNIALPARYLTGPGETQKNLIVSFAPPSAGARFGQGSSSSHCAKIQLPKSIVSYFTISGAKYKRTEPDDWRRNEAKKKRTSGESYTSSSSGQVVAAKEFKQIKECCGKQCHAKFDRETQRDLFFVMYNAQSKEAQDSLLASYIERYITPIRSRVSIGGSRDRHHTWKYSLKNKGDPTDVCRSFLLKLFQISEKRIRIIQAKVAAGECFAEKRGTHGNQRKLYDDVYKLAIEHLELIPHRSSHYSANRSNRLYFENPSLNVLTLFTEFQRFYRQRTDKSLNMKFKTYLMVMTC
ncbi:unnamed protein product [Nesidiocoris tenuis]|uniref:Uncharacterized protein n=1 Tax=Nesidiocoris tenuis TaxID=355587 RepID=A0A6H5HCY9_9HEMI|nr:unnamed protein product [Nesidiocoris tenuis]